MNYTTYLRWGVISGLFLTLIVPFIVADGGGSHGLYIPMTNLFFPYITGKNFIFRILVEITLALYLVLAVRDPRYRPRASWILWGCLAFGVWMAIATGFSADPIKSFWSNFERMEGYVSVLHLFAYFIVAGAVLTADNLWERFFNTSIGASMVMGVYALLQTLHWFGMQPSSQSGARADTSFGNATYLAVYMLINIFLTLYMLARRGRGSAWAQSVYGLALVLQVAGLYLTETRGALLGVVGGLVIGAIWIGWQARGREYKVLRYASLSLIGVVIVFAGAFFALRGHFAQSSGTLGRLASISLNDPTTIARLKYIWPTALKGAEERPLTGWGQENFSYVFNAHYQPGMWNQEQWFDRAHNQFLDWLIAGGFPAFVIYIALFCLMAWAVVRSDKLSAPEQAAMLGLLAAYAFNNLFVFDNLTSSMYFFALLAYLHGMTRAPLPARLWLSRPASDHMVAVVGPVIVVVIAVGGWALNAPGLARAQGILGALNNAQNPDAALVSFKQALGTGAWPGGPLGTQEVVEQLENYAGNGVAGSNASTGVKQSYFNLSADAAKALMAQRQGDARLELFLSGFYSQFGDYDDALAHGKAALALSPQKQQILIQLGLTYINEGDQAQALANFKQAYDEAPDNDQALVYYALGEYETGNTKAGDALLAQRFGSPTPDNDQVLSVFAQLKMYDRVIAIWKLRAQKSPKDLNTLLSLASAYYQAGDKPNTIATLKSMEQINPAVAGQIEQLISQVENDHVIINAK